MPQMLIYLDEEINKKIEEIVKEENSTKSDIVLKLIKKGLI